MAQQLSLLKEIMTDVQSIKTEVQKVKADQRKVSDCTELAYACAQFISTTLVLPDPSIDQYLVVAKVMRVQ